MILSRSLLLALIAPLCWVSAQPLEGLASASTTSSTEASQTELRRLQDDTTEAAVPSSSLVSSDRHRILEHRQGRRDEFQQRLDEVRQQLERSPANDRLLRKAIAYQRKVESLSEELNDPQLEHLLAREEWFVEQQNTQASSRRLRGRRRQDYE